MLESPINSKPESYRVISSTLEVPKGKSVVLNPRLKFGGVAVLLPLKEQAHSLDTGYDNLDNSSRRV